MRAFLVANAGWMLILGFMILGWAYYMAATILMRGSIFVGLRGWINVKAATGSRFFSIIREMLGCLMCTATEAALWTLGVLSFSFGIYYGAAENILGAVLETTGVISPDRTITMPWFIETVVMGAISFALSLAVAGQAWVIKTIVEHREVKFLTLREEFRTREIELLSQINDRDSASSGPYEYDLS